MMLNNNPGRNRLGQEACPHEDDRNPIRHRRVTTSSLAENESYPLPERVRLMRQSRCGELTMGRWHSPGAADTRPEATQPSWSSLTRQVCVAVVILTTVVGSSGSEAPPRSRYPPCPWAVLSGSRS